MPNKQNQKKSQNREQKLGFTIIEVMLVLAISGLMLIGVLGGTFDSIQTQRYNDSLNGFAESLRKIYNEVLNPRSSMAEGGGASNKAIYGKIIIFKGDTTAPDKFYSVTLVGNVKAPEKEEGFIEALANQQVKAMCNTVSEHTVSWGSGIYVTSGVGGEATTPYKGAIIIARSPLSGSVHMAITNPEKDLNFNNLANPNSEWCEKESAALASALRTSEWFVSTSDLNFCVKSPDATVPRVVQLRADGTNTSAVKILTETESLDVGCKQ